MDRQCSALCVWWQRQSNESFVSEWQEPGAKYYKQNYVWRRCVVRWYLACTSHDHLSCHLADYVAKMAVPGCYILIRHNFAQCERAPICRQRWTGTNVCRITVPESPYQPKQSPSNVMKFLKVIRYVICMTCGISVENLKKRWHSRNEELLSRSSILGTVAYCLTIVVCFCQMMTSRKPDSLMHYVSIVVCISRDVQVSHVTS